MNQLILDDITEKVLELGNITQQDIENCVNQWDIYFKKMDIKGDQEQLKEHQSIVRARLQIGIFALGAPMNNAIEPTIEFLEVQGTWRQVDDAARTTIGKGQGTKEPSSSWKTRILRAEHSPIRQLHVRWKWNDLKSWVSVHFIRHKIGIEHFVQTQRTDRTGINRDMIPQSALVSHECIANVQSIINISRKRLCFQAAKETQQAWELMLDALALIEPELYHTCVPECVYRGFCPELTSCRFHKTDEYHTSVLDYRG
jgi:hypothetical protein